MVQGSCIPGGSSQRAPRDRAPMHEIVVIDDDPERARLHVAMLRDERLLAHASSSADDVIERCSHALVVVTALQLNGMTGYRLLERLRERSPGIPVVVLADGADGDGAALRAGAYDFVAMPVDPLVLGLRVRRAAEFAATSREYKDPRTVDRGQGGRSLGSSEAMKRLRELVARVASSDVTVLVHGETGTGKELVARTIHEESARSGHRFLGINCAAVPAALLEAEFFGHARGAYTDAKTSHEGFFVQASGGTLFLDEIGDMPLEMQAKLLRALQEHRVRPIGGNTDVPFDTRVISATHQNLEELVEAGRFREDLYYRINVVALELPPLRARGNDVIDLATEILAHAALRNGRTPMRLTPEVVERLLNYNWVGNVRELENCMERAVALARGDEVTIEDLPARIRNHKSLLERTEDGGRRRIVTLETFQERYIRDVIEQLDGNKSAAADALGLDRRTLYRRLERYDAAPRRERP